MTREYKVNVGSDISRPWERWKREDLEYSAMELGFSLQFIKELSDQELFNKIISEGCRQEGRDSIYD